MGLLSLGCFVSIPYRLNEIFEVIGSISDCVKFQFLIGSMKFCQRLTGCTLAVVSIPYRLNEIFALMKICLYRSGVSIPYRLNEMSVLKKMEMVLQLFQFLIGSMK